MGTYGDRTRLGLSWTPNPRIAQAYAEAWPGRVDAIYAAQIEPEDVICRFIQRESNELVVDPDRLPQLRRLT